MGKKYRKGKRNDLFYQKKVRGGGTLKEKAAFLAAVILATGMTGTAIGAEKDIVEKGAQPIAYDISPANDGTNIAIGKNAKVFIGGGTQESMLSFGEKVHQGFLSMHIHDNAHAKQNLPEAIAIGTNSYARTGAIEIGAHTLAENKIAIGDTTADRLRQFGVASTTLGTNSYAGGGFATTLGSYNVQSSQYEAKDHWDTLGNATKNAFATVVGTFNSNESMTGSSSSGVANMIAGTANKVTNSNGAIVMGAGNSVKESSSYIDASPYSKHFDSAADMQKALMDGVAKSAGGATLVIGGANSAEKTQNSQIMGVGNSMKSTTSKKVQYNYLDGFNSSITDASHVKVLGQSVTINKGADSNTVIGDYRTVAENQTNNVIVGNGEEKSPLTTSNKETVILGFKANASFDGSVALGAGSLADTKAGIFGWDPGTQQASTLDSPLWKSSWAAVSVGDSAHTRQITHVAAGYADTDAVNVAQLKAAMENAAPKLELLAGDGIKIEKGADGKRYTISANLTGGETATDSTEVKPKADGAGSGSGDSQGTPSETDPGKPLEILAETKATNFAADEGSAAVKPSETLNIIGDGKNLSTKVEGNTLSVNLEKNLAVDSVTAGSTKLSTDGVTIAGGPSMTKDGVDAGSKKITNVAAGTEDTDGVNYGQLKSVANRVEENTQNINKANGRISKLDSRLNKVGAGAAALAALHPQDFNPDDKWDFAVGFGNYRDASAMALGAFYRPDDRTMFSVAGNFGNGENMINAGLSFKLGKSSPYAGMDRQAMIHRLASQDRELEAQNQRIAKLEQLVAQLMAK
ncbi:YadA-like family protein [Acidaminococcus fermentans]|uniref:YadA-like family protein n=1 Tax=Acidaminococcus fermentans TaxID=905 RepID=UPI00265DBC30|nr:YadA-like family protein [Acidaminococcus fermentans]